MTTVYTIGHSTHDIEEFLSLLTKSGITAVADVRSAPYSRRLPQFNREALRVSLSANNIAYVFLGVELGGRGSDESMHDECGRVKYSRIAESPAFGEGLERIRTGSERMTVALMCSEKDPLYCHRGILISRHLVARGVQVVHIHADGQTESHLGAENRLRRLVGLREPDLFRSNEQILADAYERQEARIAYVTPADRSRHEAFQ